MAPGFRWGLFFAVSQPAVHFAFVFFEVAPWSMMVSVINLLIRIAVLCAFAWLVAYTVRQRHRIAALEGLLPVCAWCRKIRDEQNNWQPLDSYLSKHAKIDVTHSICPDCMSKTISRRSCRSLNLDQAAAPGLDHDLPERKCGLPANRGRLWLKLELTWCNLPSCLKITERPFCRCERSSFDWRAALVSVS